MNMSDSESRLAWRTARRCGESGTCVEVALLDDCVAVRDSTNPQGPVLRFGHPEWDTFVAGIRAGDFESL
jgi:hypothetical protein